MKISNLILSVILLGLLVFMAVETPTGCAGAAPKSDLPTVRMKIGDRTFTLEVAATPASRERGLMFRESMPDDHGMIFVFPDEAMRRFWMMNTKIPLDIIYINAARKIVAIKPMKPHDLIGVTSDEPAKYAIELNKDMARKIGVKVGDVLEIPEGARETKE